MLIDDLRECRRSSGLSQRALAARLGVDVQSVKRLEKAVGSVPVLLSAMRALNFRLSGLGRGSSLPEQLRDRRLRRGLSITAAAARAGLSRGTVAALEDGRGSVASLLSLVDAIAPGARRRAQERSYWGEGDRQDRDSRFTPADFMDGIYQAFGAVDLDPCAHEASPVVARRRIMLSEGGDGLVEDWSGRLVFMNPPFSELLVWLRRAHEQWRVGNVSTVVCLVPVRTDSAWFHDVLSADAEIYLLRGRVRFLDAEGKAQPTPFSLMVVTLGAAVEQRTSFAALAPGFWLSRAGEAAVMG